MAIISSSLDESNNPRSRNELNIVDAGITSEEKNGERTPIKTKKRRTRG